MSLKPLRNLKASGLVAGKDSSQNMPRWGTMTHCPLGVVAAKRRMSRPLRRGKTSSASMVAVLPIVTQSRLGRPDGHDVRPAR